jgi:hypothetical protein
MFAFLILGLVCLGFSLLFFFAPRIIIKVSELGNKLLFTDHSTVAHRYWSGLVLLIVGVLMVYLSSKSW